MKIDKVNKIIVSKKYDASFTVGGILYNEFKVLEGLLLSDQFEELIKVEEEQNNLIGIATNSARKRIISEIKKRNEIVPEGFWNHFFNWSEEEQRLALFYICLKTYPLIMDIHIDVALKKYRIGAKLDVYDIQMRFEEIMSNDEDLASWSTSTFNKLNSRYRKALRDAGLYNGAAKVLTKPSKVSSRFWDYFRTINEQWFLKACFMDKE